MIKCIASDMDGTLLNASQEITAENKAAILKAQNQGVEFVVATGRSYSEAIFVLKEAGLECPVICVNGAEVRSKKGEIVSTNPMAKDHARLAAKVLVEQGIYFEVYTNNGTFTEDAEKGITVVVDIFSSANPEAPLDLIVEKAEERFRKGPVHEVDNYEMLFENDEHQIYKILAFSYNEEKQALGREALEQIDGLAISSSGYSNIEVTNEKAQKGFALEAFVKSQGISMADTMAIGDNENDLSMFVKAGRAIAMENASFAIKAECDDVTLSNNESGVAQAILEVL